MVIILIRRFIRPNKVPEFLEKYRAQQPLNNPAFLGETLTRVVDNAVLPKALRTFPLSGPSCVTYLNVANWQSWEAFVKQFADQLDSSFDPEIETAPRQRAVLDEAISGDSN